MKHVLSKLLIFCIMLGALLIVLPETGVSAASVKLSKKSLSLEQGSSKKIKIKNKPKNAKVTYTSSDPKVAKVSKTGKVTALVPGKTTITVKIFTAKKTYKLKCKVTVKKQENSDKNDVEANIKPEDKIDYLYFRYNNSFGDGSYTIEIKRQNDSVIFDYQEFSKYEMTPVTLDKDTMLKLENKCIQSNIKSWDGFDKSDDECLDGDGFTLKIKYENGSISAQGSNMYPEGYSTCWNGILEVLHPTIEKVKENARLNYINKKHGEKLYSFYLEFSRQDAENDYDILFTALDLDAAVLLEYKIKLDTDDIYKAGNYEFSGMVDSSLVDLSKFHRIIKKYDLYSLENSVDLSGAGKETYWFLFEYDEDYFIDIYGSTPFENYQQVRKEFLDYIFEIVEGVGA